MTMNVFIVCMALAVGIVSADPYAHPHPQQGEWSNWGPWMGCSTTCGGGRDTRMRTCHSSDAGKTGGMDLTTLLLLTGGLGGDSSSGLDSLLLPLLLGGGTGGAGGFGDMNPLTLMTLLGGFGGDSTDSSTSLDSLLPLLIGGQDMDATTLLLLLSGGLGGSNSTIDPLMLMLLGGGLGGGLGGQTTETQKHCYGSRMETRVCNQQDCPAPVNCLSQWGQWGECSNGCGSGTIIRSRACNCRDHGPGYARCNGAQLYEQQQCSSYDSCPVTTTRTITTTTRPQVQCLSQWSEWGACQATCGFGMKSRTRACNCRNPSTGLPNCNNAMLYEHTSCSSGHQCGIVIPASPITPNGQWSEWSAYSECMPSGSGCYKKRERTCSGSFCEGSFEQSIECTGGSCPYNPIPVVGLNNCQVNAEQREECGYAGINRDACLQNNCCYDDSIPGTFWCFKHTQ